MLRILGFQNEKSSVRPAHDLVMRTRKKFKKRRCEEF